MDTVFSNVPCDVVRKYMFPYMDIESRINFNRVMPPNWRVSMRFKDGMCEQHEFNAITGRICNLFNTIDSYDPYFEGTIYSCIEKIMRKIIRPRVVYHFMSNKNEYATSLLDRCMAVSKRESYVNRDIEPHAKNRLYILSETIQDVYSNH